MAKGNMLQGNARGKLGDIVFFRRNGEQISRLHIAKIKNPQTDAQAAQRSRIKPIVATYRALDGVAYGLRSIGESQYNAFVKRNLIETRPAYLDAVTPAVYPGTYEGLVPPLPRIGLGDGLPVLMPYVVSIGRFPEPLYILSPWNAAGTQYGVNTLTSGAAPPMWQFNSSNVANSITWLASNGIDVSADSGSAVLSPYLAERFVNFLITNYEDIHTGFLLMMYAPNAIVVDSAFYAEIGDIQSSTLSVSWSITDGVKGVTVMNGQLFSSKDQIFRIQYDATGELTTIRLLIDSFSIPATQGTGSAIILSRRAAGRLEVSTSRLLLSQGFAQATYMSMFDPEIEAAAIVDYQRSESSVDEINLGLVS